MSVLILQKVSSRAKQQLFYPAGTKWELENVLRSAAVEALPAEWEEQHKRSLTRDLRLAKNRFERKMVHIFAPPEGSHFGQRFNEVTNNLMTSLLIFGLGTFFSFLLATSLPKTASHLALVSFWAGCICLLATIMSIVGFVYLTFRLDGMSVCDWMCEPATLKTSDIPPEVKDMMREIMFHADNQKVTGVEFELQKPSLKTVTDPILAVIRKAQAANEIDERYCFACWD